MKYLLASCIALALLLSGCATEAELADKEAKRIRRVQVHTELGATYLIRDQLDVAQQELDLALSLDSDDSQANHYMGLLQVRLKNLEKGERFLRRAVSLNPDNSDARNSYGVFLCERGRLDDADEQFQSALKNALYQSPDQANVNAGICRLKKPDRRAAAEYFRAALKIVPKQPTALINMARLSLEDGQALAARGFMQRYLEVAKDTPDVLLLAFRIERAMGAKDGQANYAVKLRGKYPDSNEVRELRALTGTK